MLPSMVDNILSLHPIFFTSYLLRSSVARVTGGVAQPVAPSADRPSVSTEAYTDLPNSNIRKV